MRRTKRNRTSTITTKFKCPRLVCLCLASSPSGYVWRPPTLVLDTQHRPRRRTAHRLASLILNLFGMDMHVVRSSVHAEPRGPLNTVPKNSNDSLFRRPPVHDLAAVNAAHSKHEVQGKWSTITGLYRPMYRMLTSSGARCAFSTRRVESRSNIMDNIQRYADGLRDIWEYTLS